MRTGATDPAEQVQSAFRLCLSRAPAAREEQRLAAFLTRERSHYATQPAEVTELLGGGGPAGRQLAERTNVAAEQRAALVLLARVLLNLDEFITRE